MGPFSSSLEYESINSDRRVCYDCYKEEEHNTEFMLSHCWKHPWWEMIADGSVSCFLFFSRR